ncbi:hypothetical protein M8C13_04535 [Crossiella sp. SN42]|uniref:hypothetical protein n=1 Tax=Crossiella sp. SN42 TaxID=2944808 RepID=UPI00207D0D1C|nr:hypothetical protein [Crossiella sp. SN42]MCO1575026.1 hypothetical protein [Crossiella sp. SN42]
MALDSRISLAVAANLTGTGDLATPAAPLSYRKDIPLLNGTGLGQANRVFSDTRTVVASGTDSLDLAGPLTDAFGAALTFAKIKAVVVVAAGGNTNNVVVTRPAANGLPLFAAAGDAIAVRPGGMFVWVAPDATAVAVTADTGDLLDVVNSAGGSSVTYDVVLIGTSA